VNPSDLQPIEALIAPQSAQLGQGAVRKRDPARSGGLGWVATAPTPGTGFFDRVQSRRATSLAVFSA